MPILSVGRASVLLLALCAGAAAQSNVLVLVADDLGCDLVSTYGEHASAAPTPTLDALAAQGVLFRRAWAAPVCSPMRASFLTGRHPFRHGIGQGLPYYGAGFELGLEQLTLPEALSPLYASAAIGKWHMAAQALSGPMHPLLSGFLHHRGNLEIFSGSAGDNYFQYVKHVDGVPVAVDEYNTTDIVDDALEVIAELPEPWFVWVAFNAPHAPFHKPPQALHTYSLPPAVPGNIPVHVRAMTQAMDTEIGRLLASMDPAVREQTVVVFLGDNGTDAPAVLPPFTSTKVKGSLYEGGVRVPLIVSGPGVARGRECASLVSTTDLFATIVELAGVDLAAAGLTAPED